MILAMLPAMSHAFTQDDQRRALHRRCSSTLCVRNSECAAYYCLHAQATGQSERRLSQRFRQTSKASGLGEVIRERLTRTFPPWTHRSEIAGLLGLYWRQADFDIP